MQNNRLNTTDEIELCFDCEFCVLPLFCMYVYLIREARGGTVG